jgi:hypothetical protein
MLKRWRGVFLLFLGIISAIAFLRLPRLAFSQARNLAITPISTFQITPTDNTLRLTDITSGDDGLYFLFSGRSSTPEVIKTDGSGTVLSDFALPSTTPGFTRVLRTSNQGMIATLAQQSTMSIVRIYSPSGAIVDELSGTQPIIDIQFLDSSLFGFAYDRVLPLYPRSTTSPEATTTVNMYGPFATFRLPGSSFGIVSLTKGTLELVDQKAHVASPVALKAHFDTSPLENNMEKGLILSVAVDANRLFCHLAGYALTEGP